MRNKISGMTQCFRHFKALMRKNFIVWHRNPGCAAFEILAPLLLMTALWIIRLQVPTTPVDKNGMFTKKYGVYLGVAPDDSRHGWGYDNNYENAILKPMMVYSDFKARGNPDPEDFNVGDDWFGAQFYGPGHCIALTDYDRPRVGSPNIAIIGNQSYVTDDVMYYYKELKKVQRTTVAKYALPGYRTKPYKSVEEMEQYISSQEYKSSRFHKGICFGIQHIVDPENPKNNTFTFHFPDKHIGFTKVGYTQAVPNQADAVWSPYTSNPDMYSYFRYQHQGFSFLQNLVAYSILKNQVDDYKAWIALLLQPMQTTTTIVDPLQGGIAVLLPLFLLLAFIPPVYNMTFKIVREKESRAKETMRIMGMTDLPYWMSWFVFYTITNTVVTTIAWATLLPAVINFSNIGYIWLFFWLYGEAIFGQIIFLQSMFTGSKYAGIVSTIIYFNGVLVNKAITGDDVTRSQKLLASLLPQVALMQGSVVFANYEGTGVGINSSTADVNFQEYSFNTALWMLFADFVIYFALGFYLDMVIPSNFGQRLSPGFLCTPSYWYRSTRRRPSQSQVDDEGLEQNLIRQNDAFESDQMPIENYESPPIVCKRLEVSGDYLRIQNLQKTFSGGFRAVKGVNMKMYDSQIFALLGHNGAGKSTIISMLTGLINKSDGGASCYDVDMFESMDEVREFMGVCPQHDVLFDDLNSREHLDIFYDFKGGDPARKQSEIDSLIADVGLNIDQNKIACTLSGGNKRKLSVCVALCGGSRLVLLDEPTSGMDLGARRNLWDMLKSYKKDKIIILTTHYMDEADVLGDRIGIMVRGELKCIGSSLFLKNRFGLGYKITFVKKQQEVHKDLEKFLNLYFRGIQKASEVHEEISFVIPKSQAQNFGSFFQQLDSRLDEFDIKSYGVSMSNLEDVFLKINQEFAPELFGDLRGFGDRRMKGLKGKKQDEPLSLEDSNPKGGSDFGSDDEPASDAMLSIDDSKGDAYEMEDDGKNLIRGSSCVRSCTASSAKRFIIYKRDWCGLLCQIVIPLLLVLFGLWLQSAPSKLTQSPPRPLSTGFYPYKQRMLINENPIIMANDGADISGQELISKFPNSTEAFEVSEYTGNITYSEFYDAVYAARNDLPLYPYRYGSFNIFQANKNSNIYQAMVFLNVTSQESTAMFPQYLYQSFLKVATGDDDLQYNVINYPYPIYQKYKDLEQAAGAFDFVFMTAIALALIPCVMVQFILNERETRIKHQQLLSGMSLIGYWTSNLFFDIIMAYIPILLIIALTFAFQTGFQGIWVLFLLFPPAVVPFTYVMSFIFKSDINAQIVTLFIHFVAGALMTVVVFALQQIPVTMVIGDALRWACTIIPSFCVTYGIIFAASGTLITTSRADDETSEGVPIPRKIPDEIWAWQNLKGDAMILVIHFFFGLIVLFLIEVEVDKLFWWCPKIGCLSCTHRQRMGPMLVKDDDVIAEEKRVASQQGDRQTFLESRGSVVEGQPVDGAPHIDCIQVNNFSKQYESFTGLPVKAVRQASFGLDYGECFALLGVNGAGKSTTFKSLTREITPTTGQISIQGLNVQRDFQEVRKLIGYCPQYDAIFPVLTVEETLKFYALIKGIRTDKIESVVKKAIKQLNLTDHRDKLAGTLSGGNKRKLSVAMALMGNPPVILLDEPSAGMDPEARRFMWQVVEKISQQEKRSAVILTTHSMEEAEALSTKLGIMVRGGVFRCMGSTQHIKNKFGVGYEVEIKVKKASFAQLQEMARQFGLSDNLQDKMPLAQVIEQLRASQFDKLILDQIKPNGLGSDLLTEARIDAEQAVRLRNLLEFMRAQVYGFSIIEYLTEHFDKVELLEQCGEYFKLRVPMEGTTIGWLFGQLEQEKNALGIQDYSVSQTTLEQIFQNFANQSIASDKNSYTFVKEGDRLVLLNPNRETLMELPQQNKNSTGIEPQMSEDLPVPANDTSSDGRFQTANGGDPSRFQTAAEDEQDHDQRLLRAPESRDTDENQ